MLFKVLPPIKIKTPQTSILINNLALSMNEFLRLFSEQML